MVGNIQAKNFLKMKIALAKGTCDLQCMIVLAGTGKQASANFYTGQCIN